MNSRISSLLGRCKDHESENKSIRESKKENGIRSSTTLSDWHVTNSMGKFWQLTEDALLRIIPLGGQREFLHHLMSMIDQRGS